MRRYERAEDLRVDGRVSRPQARGMRKRVERRAPLGARGADGRATLAADGRTAIAPADAPPAVQRAIAAANRITSKPYRYGGGHGRFATRGYDCSGAVSYVLHGAGLLAPSTRLVRLDALGSPRRGPWITVYANGGHAYVVIAGLRFDTSGRGEAARWRPEPRSARGYVVRHPRGL